MHASTLAIETRKPWLGASLAVCAGLFACVLVAQIGSVSPKISAGLLGGAALVVAAIRSGRPKAVFLGAFAFSLTYNRQFFVFDWAVGKNGAQGPYVVIGDVFLVLLIGLWVYDAVLRKQSSEPLGVGVGRWFLPFAGVCLLSALLADRTSWSLFEMIRQARILLLLVYFRYQVRREEWWACLTGIGLAVFAQSAIGVAEVVTGRSGVLGILGFGSLEDVGPVELRQESFYGWRRATATMSHPPNLACYLLMTVPILCALGFTAQSARTRLVAFAAAGAGLAGLACTLSRWPLAVMACQLVLLLMGLAGLRLISLQRALGTLIFATFVAMVAAIPFAEQIADRATRDFSRSVDFRVRENETGLRIAAAYPLLGVGLNNYREHLLKHNPEWEWALQYEEFSIRQLHIRPIASPHNGFLLILAETGVLGLAAFVLFLLGVTGMAIRSLRRTSGALRAACFGIAVGLIGLVLQQAVDFSIWADPLLYTFALFGALLNVAPDIGDSTGSARA